MNPAPWVPPPALALLLAALGHLLDGLFPQLPHPSLPTFGLLLLADALTLAITAWVSFWRLGTTVLPHGTPTALVTGGPYRWTRNPMYLALSTALWGFAFYIGGLVAYLAPLAFHFLIDRWHIPFEEARLSALFGADYARYRQRVPRWL